MSLIVLGDSSEPPLNMPTKLKIKTMPSQKRHFHTISCTIIK